MKPILELVREQPFVDGLDEAHVALIAGCARNVAVAQDTLLFREGEPADAFYLIRQGTVALEMHMPGRDTLSFLTLKSGELLGVNWIAEPYRCANDARAVKPVRALKFDAQCLRAKFETDHDFGYVMMKRFLVPLVARLQLTRQHCAQLFEEHRYLQENRPT